ncbi:hypothetical protein CMI48_01350 [Candidatus Pacearchaeota archaeon]|jgi:predicted CopG family antitoxin|nr:hypothetical protein [Candidatus Pacearchaeota archaeon]|tara:strand:+ start:2185 stop:2421 length:237 start_codon:yes stop_codon:yes gene_type:complete
MVNINISLKKEAYDYLKARAGKEKSFSDVVLDFKEREQVKKGSKEALLKFAGVLKNIDWEKRKKVMADFRNEVEQRLA